jgi:energy-coupling factor transporter ATP-binding protein EcfA2
MNATSIWNAYPPDYRGQEVRAILAATRAGECVSVIGLSGAGKSNLLGFLAHTQSTPQRPLALIDVNRLPAPTPEALFSQIGRALSPAPLPESRLSLDALSALIDGRLAKPDSSLTLLLDRFDALTGSADLAGNLRALRDAHKYQLTFVTATRRPLPPHSEMAELFYAHSIWLGVLPESDARWNVQRYAERLGLKWGKDVESQLITASLGYPSFLRAVCEAHAEGAAADVASLSAHPAVQKRVEEFLADQPTEEELRRIGLADAPVLKAGPVSAAPTAGLTAKESRLLNYFQAHPHVICEKDDLIRAVWPEDKVFERGVRDDSLAQLVRRLREKIEPDAGHPRHIHTAAGRGYRYEP